MLPKPPSSVPNSTRGRCTAPSVIHDATICDDGSLPKVRCRPCGGVPPVPAVGATPPCDASAGVPPSSGAAPAPAAPAPSRPSTPRRETVGLVSSDIGVLLQLGVG